MLIPSSKKISTITIFKQCFLSIGYLIIDFSCSSRFSLIVGNLVVWIWTKTCLNSALFLGTDCSPIIFSTFEVIFCLRMTFFCLVNVFLFTIYCQALLLLWTTTSMASFDFWLKFLPINHISQDNLRSSETQPN